MKKNKGEKEEKSPKTKEQKFRTAIITVGSIAAVFMVLFLSIYFVAGSFFFKFALDANYAQSSNIPKDANDLLEQMPLPDTEKEWLMNIPKTTPSIKSRDDGYNLVAYQILADNNEHKWVITVHGYRGSAKDNGHYAKAFYEKGFNVLMPDLEGHGNSEGKYVGMGYTDKYDILDWIDYIIELDPDAKIVLHGVSMGGATVMMTTGEKLPSNVKCAVEDCGYTNVYEIFKHVASEFLNLPFKNTLLSAVDLVTRVKLGVPLKQSDSVAALKKSTTPTMFIHGNKDTFVPFWMLDVVYNANNNIEKQKLVVEGATHGYSASLEPELYFKSVFEFVEKYI